MNEISEPFPNKSEGSETLGSNETEQDLDPEAAYRQFDSLSSIIKHERLPQLRLAEQMCDEEFTAWLQELFALDYVDSLSDEELQKTLTYALFAAQARDMDIGKEIFGSLKANEQTEPDSIQVTRSRLLNALLVASDTNDKYEYGNKEIKASAANAISYFENNPLVFGVTDTWSAIQQAERGENILPEVKQKLYAGIAYQLPYENQAHLEELQGRLDLVDPGELRNVLQLLRILKYVESSQAYNEQEVQTFFNNLYQSIDITEDANYFAANQIQDRANRKAERFAPELEYDPVPVKIAKGWYVSCYGNEISFATEKLKPLIDADIADIKNIVKAVRAIESGEDDSDEVDWDALPEGDLYDEYRTQIVSLRNYCDESIDDVLSSEGIKLSANEQSIEDEYEMLLQPTTRSIIERDFSVPLAELSVQEQLYFLGYLKKTTIGTAKAMQSFTALYGVDGMRTFLSLERFGEEFGEQIINLGTEHHKEVRRLFAHYATLLDRAAKAEAVIAAAYEGEVSVEVLEVVRNKMLTKADSTLKQAMADGKREGLLEAIEQTNDEAAGFGETFVALKAAGLVDSVEDMKLEKKVHTGESVLEDKGLLAKIEGLYRQRYDKETATRLIDILHTKLGLDGATITTISILAGELAASLLEVDDGERVYVGALNTSIDRGTQQLQLGTHMINSIVERKAEAGKILDATAVTENAMAYINRYKFVATRVLDTTTDGQSRLMLERNDSRQYQSSGMTTAEIKLLEQSADGDDVLVRRIPDKNQVPVELGRGYVCTKIVPDKGELLFVLQRNVSAETELTQLSQAA